MSKVFECWLDVNAEHPQLYGEAILPRDSDGIGFTLGLEKLKGKYVRITVEEIEPPRTEDCRVCNAMNCEWKE